ncbi:MAG TPA: DNA-directed RNA polymerase subunit beta', partial [Candidatus Marinimicrobia bacterium]|nr:DNA-directed RNA polymerase subunit beta' [Candidatus Neomarinimicrobiota bacterium]
AIRSGTRRPLKSISDMIRGKTGRFRQNLLGKRVDYSGRSVIVVGPELSLHECGLPKDMGLELFKPHMISELIARGYAQTPRSAKLLIEDKDPIVYKVLEYVVQDHPVLLNRAPTLHRLGVQAFQPVLVDGKALRIHPLVCAAFNADFDGDQMAVHVPLSLAAQMEARMLMLSSHNILHPANGKPLALPSQDMVLGAYYLTRKRLGAKGEGKSFSSFEEVMLANENKSVDINTIINVRHRGVWYKDTTVGRVIVNNILPEEMDYIDDLIDKKRLSKLVNETYLIAGNKKTVIFLDKLKNLGFDAATKAGLSIAISDILIPDKKHKIIDAAQKEVDDIQDKFKRHVLTDGERYNKVIDIWTHATSNVAATMMNGMESSDQGFNPVYMMADSGARGSQDQIKQLAGMRGLMAKPKKSMTGGKGEIIESPITSNFKEGLSVQEYFISTHGARKGLADTALKTADAGYLTRRLVDVAQDVVISETDCGTINGILADDLKEGEDIIEPLSERILGRTILEDFIEDGKVLIKAGTMIRDDEGTMISDSNIESIQIRSVLTCESLRGVCAKCYGWNPSNHKLVDLGTAVGIQAAQSIGEPGTQLTLRTFHIGGTATRIIEQSEMQTRRAGVIKYSDNLESADAKDESGILVTRCMVRHSKISIIDKDGQKTTEYNVPYGANLNVEDGEKVEAGTILFQWDPYTDVILARQTGLVELKDFIENETYQVEAVEGGKKQMVIVESKDRNLSPHVEIIDKKGTILAGGTILPVSANLVVRRGDKVVRGQTLVKIPRAIGKTRDITGGLPRVTELFEARKPSDPAVVSEIDGIVKFGETKRGVRKILVEGVDETVRKYSIPYGKHVVVHEGDKITAGTSLCEGSISPADILSILGPKKVREYLVNEIQEVYRLQGVKIDDKHIEVIVRQMMQKVSIDEVGDSQFLPQDRINRANFFETNEKLQSMVVITDSGDSELEEEILVEKQEYLEINKALKADGKKSAKSRKSKPATFNPLLMGITQASLNTESFISAASFQETTRVLTDASTSGKTDYLQGLKENVAVGRLIPAGSGSPHLKNILVSDPELASNEEKTPAEKKSEKEVV